MNIIYKDRAGEWRWRVVARNGRIINVSSEGYKRRFNCERSFYRACSIMTNDLLVVEGKDTRIL